MTDEQGSPRRPFIRSYDAPTTPLPKVSPEELRRLAFPERVPSPPPPPRRNLGDIPLRIVYVVCAVSIGIAGVVVVYTLRAEDQPPGTVAVQRAAQASPPAIASAAPSPSATATPVVLPRVPASRSMTVFPGGGTAVASLINDQKSGISYAKFGAPWRSAKADPFQFRQRSGEAVIASGPLPGADPGTLSSQADFRKIATRAARWTLRYQPEGATLRWTASQPVRYGTGWLLGYRVTYQAEGEKRTSEAIVALVDTGRAKPAMLFASIPGDREELHRDLNMLVWTLRPL
ncbi:hypothetical protein Aph01nite_71950 [Acrocarpospora phusangensis]|uniref:Uncharacterized protein n=1 Tax=Acrocarpospora phusangensis TaxID=1070424 RepID=A0A919QMB9_9ACTN|nr:hypothetical protein [Acrocarpospora phusangensis]GIH28885.1 hypothetical protein Aph01nite_71950 [Acrocarpospora phusangensis]